MPDYIFNIFLFIHVAAGSIALAALPITFIARKGERWHNAAGLVFYYAMLVMATGALGVTIPRQNWLFLCIAVFSAYLTLSGRRALAWGYEPEGVRNVKDIALAWGVGLAGIGLLTIGTLLLSGTYYRQSVNGFAFIMFGGISVLNAYNDLRILRAGTQSSIWLRTHLTKMTAAGISAVTAFFVLNGGRLQMPSLLAWVGPTVVGTLLITWWRMRLAKGWQPGKRRRAVTASK